MRRGEMLWSIVVIVLVVLILGLIIWLFVIPQSGLLDGLFEMLASNTPEEVQ